MITINFEKSIDCIATMQALKTSIQEHARFLKSIKNETDSNFFKNSLFLAKRELQVLKTLKKAYKPY